MNKRSVLLCALLSVALLSGCAGTIPTESYTPQNFVRYENGENVDIKPFTYAPLATGKVKANQIQNTAAGSIYISGNVAEMVRRATALELEKTGIRLNDRAAISLSGDVLEFKADDLGYSVHWTYAVRYTLMDQSGQKLYSSEYRPPMKKTGKFGLPSDLAPIVHEVVLNGYDLFIRDASVRAILDKPVANPAAKK